jgi:hypothetical protein
MRSWHGQLVASLAGAALLGGTIVPASAADPVADFYAGKTLRILVGFGAGGGYDLYAFDAVMRDGEFLAEAKRLALEVRPASGDDVQALFGEIYAAPPAVVARASELIKGAP